MKLLFDQSLSRYLIERLGDPFPGSAHLTALGLDRSSDHEIWEYARDDGFAVVSKESDFRPLAFRYGAPPKVIWLRVDNASTKRFSSCGAAPARAAWMTSLTSP